MIERYFIEDVAARWQCHPQSVRRIVRSGDLRAVKVARRWMVTSDDLAAYEESRENRAPIRRRRRRAP
ncbi:Periplasmic molybdate-binding protein/domain (fragment) [Nostocoides japonicum T1-X7]|uniref:Periplasmic molybdate-binding protein/domain n=1 Tax=Nostocoides japonicum T1-X7 TaxID=1194083 RepID=A0A077LVP1_9MICO